MGTPVDGLYDLWVITRNEDSTPIPGSSAFMVKLTWNTAARALVQALAVGLATFGLIVGVEFIWAGQLIDVRLYALTSAGVALLVFLISLFSTKPRCDVNRHTADRH